MIPLTKHKDIDGWHFVVGRPHVVTQDFTLRIPSNGSQRFNLNDPVHQKAILIALVDKLIDELPLLRIYLRVPKESRGNNKSLEHLTRLVRFECMTATNFRVVWYVFHGQTASSLALIPTDTTYDPVLADPVGDPFALIASSSCLGDDTTKVCYQNGGGDACFKPRAECEGSHCRGDLRDSTTARAFHTM